MSNTAFTPEVIAAQLAVCEAATEGPWEDDGRGVIARGILTRGRTHARICWSKSTVTYANTELNQRYASNRAFIAETRDLATGYAAALRAVAALLEEVKVVRKERDEYEQEADRQYEGRLRTVEVANQETARAEAALREILRLQGLLAQVQEAYTWRNIDARLETSDWDESQREETWLFCEKVADVMRQFEAVDD